MKRVLIVLIALLVVLTGLILLRAGRGATPTESIAPIVLPAIDSMAVARRLAEAIRIPTITDDRPIDQRAAPFDSLRVFLEKAYPRVHAALPRELISRYSLLYRWTGSDPALPAILLMGHLDVVPVARGSESEWKHAPFGGEIADGEVWGRGALDDKQQVIALLDAVELLVTQGFQPRRTVYLFFGHDEEGAGTNGAHQAAALLQQRKVQLDFVLDEGGIIANGVLPGVRRPVALVKVAEKGYLTLELSVRGSGGHSSAPPRPTPVGILATALTRLEARPFPARLNGPTRRLLEYTAADQPFGMRVAMRNLWLFGPLVKRQMARSPATDATIRTTIAPTMLEASPKDNVLPIMARAVVNFRVMPGETSQSVIAHVREAVANDSVQVRALTVSEPPVASDPAAAQFGVISRTIREIAPDVFVVPFLLTAATDSRHFAPLTPNIYGFSMARGGPELLQRAHGSNERIRIADLANATGFYVQLLRNTAAQ